LSSHKDTGSKQPACHPLKLPEWLMIIEYKTMVKKP